MGQVVARTTIAITQPLHRAVNGGGADVHPQVVDQHVAQIADAPDRDGQPVGVGTGFERRAQERQSRGIELGWAAGPRLIGETLAATRQEPRATPVLGGELF